MLTRLALAAGRAPVSSGAHMMSLRLSTARSHSTVALRRSHVELRRVGTHRVRQEVRRLSTKRPAPKKKVRDLRDSVTMAVETRTAAAQSFMQSVPGRMANSGRALVVFLTLQTQRVMKDPTLLWTGTVWSWNALKHFCQHMWFGSRLLATNVRIAGKLIGKSATGRKLMRREERLLLRTVSDLGRLIPFSFFVLIPFMELLLPVALKVFPNLLPSTFEEKDALRDRYKKTHKTRVEMAQELQEELLKRLDVLSESGGEEADEKSVAAASAAKDFTVFIEKIRKGKTIDKDDITRNAKWFTDQFTMDGLSRHQLESMCTFMGIPLYGNDGMLRFQIRRKLRIIQADDRQIFWEGLRSLSMEDLIEANHDRGMPHDGMTQKSLQEQLERWIDLSMNRAVPPSLLILSRTFVLTTSQHDTAETGMALKAAIKAIPKDVVEEIQEELEEDVLELAEKKKKKAAYKTDVEEKVEDLEELMREEKLIAEEKEVLDGLRAEETRREEQLQAMETELETILGSVEQYQQRLTEIVKETRLIVEAKAEDADEVSANADVSDSDLAEMLDDRIQLEVAKSKVADLADDVENAVRKTGASAGKTKKEVQGAMAPPEGGA